jgi:FkbM family methyltransferase
LAKAGNTLYRFAPSIYRPLYSAYKAFSDRRERRLFSSWLKPGDCVLDVGANIGIYTQFLADLVGIQGTVYAIEPDSRNLMLLQKLAGTHPQVHIIPALVGSESGEAELFVSPDLNVDHRSYDSGEGRLRRRIRALTLDEIVAGGPQVSAIKIDIQGAELRALRGARDLLQSRKPLLMILEYWPFGLRQAGENPEDLLALLESSGLTVEVVGGVQLPDPRGADPNSYANIVARRNR